MRKRFSVVAGFAAIILASGSAAVVLDVKPANATERPDYPAYEQCIAPYVSAYAAEMNRCKDIGHRYGVSSMEYETCVWYAQIPYEYHLQYCSDLFL